MNKRDIYDIFQRQNLNPSGLDECNPRDKNPESMTYKRIDMIVVTGSLYKKSYFSFGTIEDLLRHIIKRDDTLTVFSSGSTTIENFSYNFISKIETTLITQ